MPQMNFENRPIVRCQRHPREFVVGVCAACLRERLACVDPVDRHTKSFPSSSTSDAKASDGKNPGKKCMPEAKSLQKKKMVISEASSSNGPQLRRSKSFSEGRALARAKIDEASSLLEPKRKSCEIRVRNTLWSLFQIDQVEHSAKENESSTSCMDQNGWFSAEAKEQTVEQSVLVREPEIELGSDSIQVPQHEPEPEPDPDPDPEPPRIYDSFEAGESSTSTRTIKSHIDLATQNRIRVEVTENHQNADEIAKKDPPKEGDSKDRTRSFWLTAIVRKRIQKWRRKHRSKHHHHQQQNHHQSRDTRSEILDEARPSCDDDPRFSIDMGRTSWEDSRHSWEEPRASWDGILIGKVVGSSAGREEIPIGSSKNQVVAEPIKCNGEEESQPGGSLEAREYYSDSSLSRRRRKNSTEKPSIALNSENDDSKSMSSETRNITKVSPATMDDDNKPMHAEANMEGTHRQKYSENPSEEIGDSKQVSKSHRWSKAWSKTITSPMWGFIQKRGGKDEGGFEGDIVESPRSDSWRELQRDREGRRTLSKADFFSNGSISSRSWYYNNSSHRLTDKYFGNKSNNSNNAQRNRTGWQRKRTEELMLDRSRSIHYSPTNVDNGLLRFYLTPLRTSRRTISGARIRTPHSVSRSTLGLY
eukprot:Gb_18901 [translate_table: standard]